MLRQDNYPLPLVNKAPGEERNRLEDTLAESLAIAHTRGEIGTHALHSPRRVTAAAMRLEDYERTDIEDLKRHTRRYRRKSRDGNGEPEKELQRPEEQTRGESFELWQNTFKGNPLMRCLDDYDFDQDPLFAKLYEEVHIPVDEVVHSSREVWQNRAYWNNVRTHLHEEDDEEDTADLWPGFPSVDGNGNGNEDAGRKSMFRLDVFMQRNRNLDKLWQERVAFETRERTLKYPCHFTMDPFSAEGELLNLHNYFHQGQYQEVIDFDTAGLSPENALPARVLSLRAQIALGQAEDVIADVQGESEPDLAAVGALAELAAGNESKAVKIAEKLAQESADNSTVQVLAGTVLQAGGNSEEALALLSQHQGNLEAVALIVQIHLQQNRTNLAIKEVQAARRWAQDSLLVNLAESWVGMRVGGEKYQQAFYVFEELAQASSTSSIQSLVSQAVAEIHLGRLEEAEAALQQALAKDPKSAEVIANSAVLNIIAGKDATELISALSTTAPEHHYLQDLQEKSALFDKAATKYSAKVKA
ncbi:Coatomer subunit epsilon [Lachnellula subtilissima]|uniref:Coatomer subunit epsilon n=1 Tax=Lachnellula subtilissima TaxID=602034 RepID=A0A8H8S0P6_9HELO|nr:Coatomer subunit epsilon [Lachnellula subtilissima]